MKMNYHVTAFCLFSLNFCFIFAPHALVIILWTLQRPRFIPKSDARREHHKLLPKVVREWCHHRLPVVLL